MRVSAFLFASSLVVAGCGGTTANQDDAGNPGNDAGVAETSTDDGAADAGPIPYPAPHTAMPQVDYNGGRVLQNPKIVTITWASDDPTRVSRLQQFGDIITSTAWWTAVSSEYCQQPGNKPCIGPGTGGGHVVIQDPPAADGYTDSSQGAASSLQDFIHDHVVGGNGITADFPAPDDNTLYVLYFPPGVTITLDGDASCDTFGAYHNTMVLPNVNDLQSNVAYAIIPRCGTKESTTTYSASHEIIEAATDPDIGEQTLSYYMLDQVWAGGGLGGEVGDLCENSGSGSSMPESTFTVQRTWSNKSAAAGHDPCVPIPEGEVYFNAAPRQSKVVLSKAGATAVLDIDAFSDAPMAPWTISAIDYASFQQGTPLLSFSLDKTSVQNGDHVQLTITAKAAMPSGGDQFAISSKDANGTRHSWPVLAAAH
jgi:hypothetical protein